MGTRKIGPAMAGGLHDDRQEPAQETPLTMLPAGQADGRGGSAQGCAVGVADHASGRLSPRALIDDGRLRKLTFTGSTGRGLRPLAKQASDKLLRLSMELGGKRAVRGFSTTPTVDAAVDGADPGPRCATAARPALRPTGSTVANIGGGRSSTEKLVKRMSEFTVGKGP